MKISKKAQYGLRAMVHLARAQKEKKIIPLKEIAKKERAPFAFLEKIISQLEKAGLVKAKKGAYGGYFLAKPANKITPGDIVSILEEDMTLVHCAGCPMAGSCTSEDVWDEVQESLDNTLNAISLADLIKSKK
ncbi:Rrf2 family transcriptional regulator [Patescibacteria group bacterium]|nr:Rrf2 family transcriptional regulator [Patescibacteria group bacterium]MBU4275010.1 Rrf2 family transcriptional regulator [Patescibacteria group bacterium]MBU4367283.1 Rrf2 family transcriptional regulator [Patescibacteria group bacterium]MBU4462000.1 Rrf2 family transcriptional regulator [Patescibacteria group bacterium]MCG2700191.1 Rrf2 family transcriptional regulator [Candidatus Parcubacteria bacterium]